MFRVIIIIGLVCTLVGGCPADATVEDGLSAQTAKSSPFAPGIYLGDLASTAVLVAGGDVIAALGSARSEQSDVAASSIVIDENGMPQDNTSGVLDFGYMRFRTVATSTIANADGVVIRYSVSIDLVDSQTGFVILTMLGTVEDVYKSVGDQIQFRSLLGAGFSDATGSLFADLRSSAVYAR